MNLVETAPHSFTYDNVNASTSDFVEQRPDAPSKVQSGTFSVLYKLQNARFEDMRIEPLMANLRASTDLTYDICPTNDQLCSYRTQALVHIVNVLIKHHNSFADYANHPLFKHKARRAHPPDLKTEFYPLRISTIEEASIKGNLLVHDDVYNTQLKQDSSPTSRLATIAKPTYADLLTLARMRGCVQVRTGDINAWTRREIFQLAMGLFHLLMNLIWALLHMHRGKISQVGSLAYFFVLLDKTRLSAAKPDFHSLLSTFQQILDGIILHAWQIECGCTSLEEFAESKPTPEQLLSVAASILKNHSTPLDSIVNPPPLSPDVSEDEDDTLQTSASLPRQQQPNRTPKLNPQDDILHQNLRLMMRDFLYVRELTQAISDGDIGRVEDIFPDLARIFRGSGSNNYSTEILHFLHNVKKVWTPEFAYVWYWPYLDLDIGLLRITKKHHAR